MDNGDNGPMTSNETCLALQLFQQLMSSKVPREISLKTDRAWFVFTDACYEAENPGGTAGVGAVLVDQLGRCRGFIAAFLSDDLLAQGNEVQDLDLRM